MARSVSCGSNAERKAPRSKRCFCRLLVTLVMKTDCGVTRCPATPRRMASKYHDERHRTRFVPGAARPKSLDARIAERGSRSAVVVAAALQHRSHSRGATIDDSPAADRAGGGSEPVLLGGIVPVVLRRLHVHRRSCGAGRRNLSRTDRAICVSFILRLAERNAGFLLRDHPLHGP